jgi:hypothetical protein
MDEAEGHREHLPVLGSPGRHSVARVLHMLYDWMTDMGEVAENTLADSRSSQSLAPEGVVRFGASFGFVERVLHIHVVDTTDSQLYRLVHNGMKNILGHMPMLEGGQREEWKTLAATRMTLAKAFSEGWGGFAIVVATVRSAPSVRMLFCSQC